MGIREMIKKMQNDSGFSDAESKEALEMTVEALAERLNDGERMDFASQLPEDLQIIALSTEWNSEYAHKDILQEFMEREQITQPHAKKQLLSAWKAIKASISDGEVRHIKSQLPKNTSDLLY